MMAKEGYAIVPMHEYLSMHDELKILKQTCETLIKTATESAEENAWLKEQIQQLKLALEECGDALQNCGGE